MWQYLAICGNIPPFEVTTVGKGRRPAELRLAEFIPWKTAAARGLPEAMEIGATRTALGTVTSS